MATRATTIKRPNLEGFVRNYPDKAVEILMRCCHDLDIEREILQFLLDPDQPPKNKSLNTLDTTNANNAHVTSNQRFSPAAQRTSSFSNHHQQPSRSISGMRHNTEPPSPPRTGSNYSKSVASKEGIENIVILTMDEDDDIKKLPATLKTATIEYSVIGQHMLSDGRICESEIEEIDERQISIPQRGIPGTLVDVTVSSRVQLTWRRTRTKSNASHSTTFYLVRQEFLDIDVLLGSLDSGEGIPEPMSPHFQKGQALNFREHTLSTHAGSSHLESYHRSDANDDPRHFNRVQPGELVDNFVRSQRERVTAPPRKAPGATPQQRTEPSRTFRPATADPTSPTHTSSQDPGSEKIRVSCTLGSGSFKFWLDLDAPAQAFFQTVQPQIEKKRGVFDRTTVLFVFGRDRQMSDDQVCELPLGEDELEADWEETVMWIKENKGEKAPQIYAAVQFDEG